MDQVIAGSKYSEMRDGNKADYYKGINKVKQIYK